MGHYIFHDNNLRDTAVTITADEHADGPADYLTDPSLFNCWRCPGTTPGQYMRATFDFGSGNDKTADYWAIAGHNLADYDPDIILEYSSDGATWNTADSATLSNNDNFAAAFTSQTDRYWRFSIDAGMGNTINTGDYLSVLYFGSRLEIERLQVNFSPPALAQGYAAQNNINKNGHFIGRSNRFAPFPVKIPIRNVTPAWGRANLPGLMTNIASFPFFVQWDDSTSQEAAQVAYCWTDKEPKAPRMRNPKYMDFYLTGYGLKYTLESDGALVP